jgi:hypothetical protein
LLSLLSHIRHWLENRRTNVAGMLQNFESAAHGEELSPFHLSEQPAMSDDHAAMVNRVWSCAPPPIAPDVFTKFHGRMDDLRRAWEEFEDTRLTIKRQYEQGLSALDQLQTAVTRLQLIASVVDSAISSAREIEVALKSGQ